MRIRLKKYIISSEELWYEQKGSLLTRQRIVVKIEVNSMGSNVRFVVTSNRNNKQETVYRHYCQRGTMELWITSNIFGQTGWRATPS